MTTRREINRLHEASVVEAALKAHNKLHGTSFSVQERPDPPDAILVDGSQNSWIQHTDAFYPGWAEDLTSYAATDKTHRPMRKGLHMNMDELVADAFAEIVLKKFNNPSYIPIVKQYGPGILIVGLESPWLDEDTVLEINKKWIALGNPDISTVFQWVYLGRRINGRNIATLWELA